MITSKRTWTLFYTARDVWGMEYGKGAVLYDTRDARYRPCCSEGGRCLHHITEVWTDTDGYVMYEIWDGTHTTREYVLEGDMSMFKPAGWTFPVGLKPTYHLTRNCGVHDHHDRMTTNA